MSSTNDTKNTDEIIRSTHYVDSILSNKSSKITKSRSFESLWSNKQSEDGGIISKITIFSSASDTLSDCNNQTDIDEDGFNGPSQLFEDGNVMGMTMDDMTKNIVEFDANNYKRGDNVWGDISDIDLLDNFAERNVVENENSTTHLASTADALDLDYLFLHKSDDVNGDNKSTSIGYVQENSVDVSEQNVERLLTRRKSICGTYYSFVKPMFVSFISWFNQAPVLVKLIITGPCVVLIGAFLFVTVSTALSSTTKIVKENKGSLLSMGDALFSTDTPTFQPSESIIPTSSPSLNPSASPSKAPTEIPSISPSYYPTSQPSSSPSNIPSQIPSLVPTQIPSMSPSSFPSISNLPTSGPTISSRPSNSPSSSPTHAAIIFYVLGDVPYSTQEETRLYAQLYQVPEDAQFLVHVGDIRQGKGKCKEKEFENVKNILQSSEYPMFIVPGDNDIIDCSNVSEAKKYWDKRFISFENNWQHSLPVQRQAVRQENFSFFLEDVLFLGLNIIGGDGYTTEEWTIRLDDNLDWALAKMDEFRDSMVGLVIFGHGRPISRHNTFFMQLSKEIESVGIPSLYIHGDGHQWKLKKASFGVENLLRVQVDRGGIAAPLKVKFQRDADSPFEFFRDYPMRSLPPTWAPSKMPTTSPRPSPNPTRQPTPRPTPRPTKRPIPRPIPRPTNRPINRPPPPTPPPPPQEQCCFFCFWCW